MDTFRIALTDEPELFIKQKHSQDGLGCLFYFQPHDTENLFMLTLREFADKTLKNHDIISGKTPTDKSKNTYKRQVCNQQ